MIFVHSVEVIKWLFRCTYFSPPCCSDLGEGGWVSGNPNIVRILKIRTQKWTVPYGKIWGSFRKSTLKNWVSLALLGFLIRDKFC